MQQSDSDEELEAALAASMEPAPVDSDEELEAALAAHMEHAPDMSLTQRQIEADAKLANTLQQQEFDAAEQQLPFRRIQQPEIPFRRIPSRQCLVLQLPLELQRRCLRFVSIANLIFGVRLVSKSFSSHTGPSTSSA